ncbi:kinase-like domain-containing protein [Aspergillus sergii]|uniref:non-specific serine/threonine protein kinase n=1 Tax=Aspergillus sergii TaxID=1034303 RepID=A0A5N6XBK6_9EURO|nr:kinase-like domain-containing protein [Aspergillus sergii]
MGKELIQEGSVAPHVFPDHWLRVHPSQILEEERFEDLRKGQYYPVNIGDIFSSKYQVVGKLRFGISSTVWLARDLEGHQYVTLKVYTRSQSDLAEFQIYNPLNKGSSSHPGYTHVRRALDVVTIPRAGGDHCCLVQKPMWESFPDLLYRNPTRRFTEELLKAGLMQIFLALDYLHTECKLVHTEFEDESILEKFTEAEIVDPSPRKTVNGIPVYASRRFELPSSFGRAVLSDFGSAVRGDEKRNHDAQPNVYRSPEVMLKTEWSYPVDIWNVGTMIWDLFEGKHMFYGNDPDGKGYSTRAHLAEMIGLLGPPPLDMLKRGIRSNEFFTEDDMYYVVLGSTNRQQAAYQYCTGQWKQDIEIPEQRLETSEKFLDGRNKEIFLAFMRGMLQCKPEDRKTARELLEDPWLNDRLD